MQWINQQAQWLADLGPWFALTAGLAGVIVWALGFNKVLSILEKLLDIVQPALKAVVSGIVWAGGLAWSKILWPGLRDIFDNWVTIVTVVFMGLLIWGAMEIKVDNVVDQLSFCQDENERLTRLANKVPGQTPGPFDWLFKW